MNVFNDSRYMLNKIPLEGVVDKLAQAEVVEYSPMDATDASRHYGVVGQSIEKLFPFAVEIDGMGNRFVNYEALVPVLLQAVIELSKKGRTTARKPVAKE